VAIYSPNAPADPVPWLDRLAAAPGTHVPLLPSGRGSFTIARRGEYLVELLTMIYNYRVVLTPVDNPEGYVAGWCYFGADAATLSRAALAALAFDPVVDDEPVGYDKALQRAGAWR
jgi:hypothetical protein